MSNPHVPEWAGPLASDDLFEMENTMPDGPRTIKFGGKSHHILGRSSTDATITLASVTASRVHALLVANKGDGLVYLIDLKSAHGTHIEGERLPPNKPTALKNGHEVRFGALDGGARYRVTHAPSRKRQAEGDGEGDRRGGKRQVPEGKVRALHVLIKHKDSRNTASKRDPDGVQIKKRTKEEALLILRGYMKDLKCQEITFEDLARKASDCSSGSSGGDLGFFEYGKMQPEFSKAAFALQIDEISEPVETKSGVHIILRKA